MKTVAIIQARMTSVRLPGKVLMEAGGKPLLAWLVDRLDRSKEIDQIVVATTINKEDDAVVDLCKRKGISFFRGSEDDVLSRYVEAAKEFSADIVVRITADCPLIDAGVSDKVIKEMKNRIKNIDYCSNTIKRTYPVGLDTEALPMKVLVHVNELALSKPEREHVTYMINNEKSALFRRYSVEDTQDNSHLRWSVDEAADFEMIKGIIEGIPSFESADYRAILDFVKDHPEISNINKNVRQKTL